jgi:hypothetical protein
MILDEQTLFSDQQAITASAASSNVIDLGVAKDLGPGVPIPILIQVTEDFNNLTNLAVALEVDDADTFGSPKIVQTTTVLLADLVAGKQIPPMYVPQDVDERYARLNYTVTGTAPTTGKVTAGLSMGNQTNIHG